MRTSLATQLLWSAGLLAAAAFGKVCSYGDQPHIIAHAGEPVGHEKMYNGGKTFSPQPRAGPPPLPLTLLLQVNLYISKPACSKPTVGVLYITDVFGIQHVQNKL